MESPDTPNDAQPSTPIGTAALWWLRVKQVLVIIFVTWHLFFLFVSNTQLDGQWSDATIGCYESYLGLDQSWAMFSSPWKHTPFLAVRIEFTDGSSEVLLSDIEPANTQQYFKRSGARTRKYEENLLYIGREKYNGSIKERDIKWNHFAKWRVAEWFAKHADDQREVKQVVLLKRRYEVPPPGEDRSVNREPLTTELGTVILDPK